MNARPAVPTLLMAALIALVGMSDAQAQDRRIALVVGNSRYAEAPLRNSVNDARAMAATLRERGFDVLLRENTTRTQLETAIADFGEKLNEGATGLFFYAGHGMQVNGRNYLIPVDAKVTTEQRIKFETVDVEAVLDQMQAARSKVNMMILDACRNNPFERRFRSGGGGLAQINAPEGTLIAYATAPGKVAADGDGANGLYTQELLHALRAPGLKVEDVFKQVRINVSRASQGAQTPWEASSLIGDFYFSPDLRPLAPAPPNADALFWSAIKDHSNEAELRAYLARYPNGEFASLAQLRLEAIEKSKVAATISRVNEAPAKPVQEAALPAPSAPISRGRFDGQYQSNFQLVGGVGVSGFLLIAATVSIAGEQITGHAMASGSQLRWTGGSCTVSGQLNAETGEIVSLGLECSSANVSARFKGRFAADRDGRIVGNTQAHTGDRDSPWVRWVRAVDGG